MMIKITAGLYKGRTVPIAKGSTVRPTGARARSAIFNMLTFFQADDGENRIHGAHVLDLFSGTGALSFEALSRGAASSVMVDVDSKNLKAAAAFATLINAPVRTVSGDCASIHLKSYAPEGGFNLVFMDAPYDAPGLAQQAIKNIIAQKILAEKCVIIIETAENKNAPLVPGAIPVICRSYGYEKITVSML